MYNSGIGFEKACEKPELTGINRLDARSIYIPHLDAKSPLSFDQSRSPWFRSLNGRWIFRLLAKASEATVERILSMTTNLDAESIGSIFD